MNKATRILLACTAVVSIGAATVLSTQSATASQLAASTATPTKAAATKAATTKAAATATPAAGITIQPITRTASIKSYKTSITMKLDGVSEGRAAKGDFNTEAQTLLPAKKQSFALSGSLMGQLLGKYLRGLPVSKVTVYLFDKNTYLLGQSLFAVCAVPKSPIAGLDQLSSGLSAESLLMSLSGSNKIYGTLVGDETVNGTATRHYKLDVPKMNALAKQNRIDVVLRTGDVWLAKDGNYVVRLSANADGSLAKAAGVDFKGNAIIDINVSDTNKLTDIPLPGACSRPISI